MVWLRWSFLVLGIWFARDLFACERRLEALANRPFWAPEHFSDPAHHDPKHFLYVVTAAAPDEFQEIRGLGLLEARIRSFRAPAHSIRVFAEPKRIHERPMISVSVVSHDKPWTVYRQGAVLKVPANCFYAATPKDMGTPRNARVGTRVLALPALEDLMVQHGLPRPDAILRATQPPWNEAIITGECETGERVEVSAYFYVGESADDVERPVRDGLRRVADEIKVPVLWFPE